MKIHTCARRCYNLIILTVRCRLWCIHCIKKLNCAVSIRRLFDRKSILKTGFVNVKSLIILSMMTFPISEMRLEVCILIFHKQMRFRILSRLIHNMLHYYSGRWRPGPCVMFGLIWSGSFPCVLTQWGRVTHICVSKFSILGSDNGLSPGRHQAIIKTNAGILLIWPFRILLIWPFSEILIEINTFSFQKMHLKMSSAKWRPFVSASMWYANCWHISYRV